MRKYRGLWLVCIAAVACDSPTAATRPDVNVPRTISASAGGVALAVNGAGHVLRDLGAGPELNVRDRSGLIG